MFEADNMIAEMVRQDARKPALLYHYCKKESAQYLMGYGADISARSILMSPNDKQEYRTGINLFIRYIKTHRLLSQNVCTTLAKKLSDNLSFAEERKGSIIPFAFCFTTLFNSPYHWHEFVGDGGGFCLAFSRVGLEDMIAKVVQSGKVSLRLERCLYVGYDDLAIDSMCAAICKDRRCDFVKLEQSNGDDAKAGIRIMSQVCMFASSIKCGNYYPEQEWRLIMASPNSKEANENGYLATGIKEHCPHKDILSIMRGVISSPTGNHLDEQKCLLDLLNSRNGMPFVDDE